MKNNDRIKFKTDKKEKTVNLSHETVDKIITTIDGIKSTFQYRTIKGRKKPSLLEILGSGKVTLYRDSFTTNTNNKNFSNSFNTNKYTYYYVSKSDEKWGESPCAFITLREGEAATAEEIMTFCRDNMAHYKTPRTVVFCDLPKTSTGKIQKFVL